MATGTRHRARALVSSVLDGVLVGAAEAALDHPKRSPARRRTYLVIGGALLTDALVGELPTVRAIAAGRPPRPVEPAQQQLAMAAGLVSAGWGALVTVVDGPLARVLARRGVARPHLALGIATGVVTAVSTLPMWWRRGTLRIRDDARGAAEAADLAAWEAELAAVDR